MKLRVLLVVCCLGWFAHSAPAQENAPGSEKYLTAVRKFADTVLEHGRDTYGEKQTPMFADGLEAETLEPVRWVWKDGSEWVLSNFASQQPLLRLLDGLTGVTGEKQYRAAAEDSARYVLQHATAPSGLVYWGGHTAWDLQSDGPIGTRTGLKDGKRFIHELKSHQPYFELMWRVEPEGTRKLLESIWAYHILDWSLLDYNRHGKIWIRQAPQWDQKFADDIDVPFPAISGNLSFCNVVPPFVHSGVSLATQGENDNALLWTRRLVHRWQEARHPETGLCGGQVSFREYDRAFEALGHVHPNVNEAKIVGSYHQVVRYHVLPLAQMQASATLLAAGGERAKLGEELKRWALDDLNTYWKQCYDAESGMFQPKLTDGTPLQWQKAKEGYYLPVDLAPCRPDGTLFWNTAQAYRLTGDKVHLQRLALIGPEFGLAISGEQAHVTFRPETSEVRDWRVLYGLLELHRAAPQSGALVAASQMADKLLAWQQPSGMFTRPARKYAEAGEQIPHAVVPGTEYPASRFGRTGDEVPLVLLHLYAALVGKSDAMPAPKLDDRYFHCPYAGPKEPYQQKRDDARTYDWLVFYGED